MRSATNIAGGSIAFEDDRAGTGHADGTGAGDGITHVIGAGAVQDERGVVGHRAPGRDAIEGIGTQDAGRAAIADLQHAGGDGDAAGLLIGSGQKQATKAQFHVSGRILVGVGEAAGHRERRDGRDGDGTDAAVGIDVGGRDLGIGLDVHVADQVQGTLFRHGELSGRSAHDEAAIERQETDRRIEIAGVEQGRSSPQGERRSDRRNDVHVALTDGAVGADVKFRRVEGDGRGIPEGAGSAGDQDAVVHDRRPGEGVRRL